MIVLAHLQPQQFPSQPFLPQQAIHHSPSDALAPLALVNEQLFDPELFGGHEHLQEASEPSIPDCHYLHDIARPALPIVDCFAQAPSPLVIDLLLSCARKFEAQQLECLLF